ncbi:MAG: hypothetical protein IT275_07940 [Chitinophagales bacterium]|nr:hypothetical protein [Chitinophagales bacterium]HMV14644.1 hypothetical protein [Chitinophagales bacterium]HMW13088.1 hypothetical protein [Chitinophagales bacterium]HMX60235.1 hypothetical protein [Chitinophagales bacterium]HMY22516.1 hypothetical protein [Chitinophagales bacterium]
MITKAKLQGYIQDFPDEISIDELIDRLVFIDKLENRIRESNSNETIEEIELKTEMEKWFE